MTGRRTAATTPNRMSVNSPRTVPTGCERVSPPHRAPHRPAPSPANLATGPFWGQAAPMSDCPAGFPWDGELSCSCSVMRLAAVGVLLSEVGGRGRKWPLAAPHGLLRFLGGGGRWSVGPSGGKGSI